MDFDEYQKQAHTTAEYPGGRLTSLMYLSLGLAGEAGEFSNKIKKVLRDLDFVVTPHARDELLLELGDVIWYVAELCSKLDVKMSIVAEVNLEHLADRKARNAIKGEGDDR